LALGVLSFQGGEPLQGTPEKYFQIVMTVTAQSPEIPEVKKALVIGVGGENGLGASVSLRFARRMLPRGGSLLFTGASASLRGRAGFAAFNSAKAALRTLAQAMAKELGPKGLHVGHVIVDGGIDGDQLRKGRPELVETIGEARLIELGGLADAYWFLHQQPPRAWTFELDVRSKVEPW